MGDTAGNGQPEEKTGTAYRTSLATRLAVAVLVVSILSILVAVIVSVASISESAEDLIENRISARANALADELDRTFQNSVEAVQFLAESDGTVEAIEDFAAAYRELDAVELSTVETARENLGLYYLEEFVPALADVRGQAVDPLTVAPRTSPAPIYLQDIYIAQNTLPPDERRLLTDPNDGSAWTAAHQIHHPDLRSKADGFGFVDLFLIDADTRSVVYSTNKDIAFGTNVVSGPHSGTAMAGLARRAFTEGVRGEVLTADLAPYTPLLDLPSGFIAAPVFSDDEIIGVVVASLDIDQITEIVTQDWRAGRFGETGEVYLVGQDRTMRSDSRVFIENPAEYLLRIDEVGTISDIDRQRMEALGTTVVFQPVDNESVRSALAGEADVVTVTNYLGEEVFSAHRPVAAGTFDWAMMVEQQVAEAEEPLSDYVRSSLTITVVFMVLLTFISVGWASALVAPLRRMGAALESIRIGQDPVPIPVTGVTEFRGLALRLNAMVDSLEQRKEQVLAALRAKTAILRTLLPPSAVAQVQVGERRFAETVPQASVAVVKLRGIDELIGGMDSESGRVLLMQIVDTADRIAQQHGLDRVKLTGATYQAVCGLETPHLDHAPRAVEFVSDCISALDRLAHDAGLDVSTSAGVASGTVTAGLVGDSRLVFDLWGDPVEDATRLASTAPVGRIYVSAATRPRLPSSVSMIEVTTTTGETAWMVDRSEENAEAMP